MYICQYFSNTTIYLWPLTIILFIYSCSKMTPVINVDVIVYKLYNISCLCGFLYLLFMRIYELETMKYDGLLMDKTHTYAIKFSSLFGLLIFSQLSKAKEKKAARSYRCYQSKCPKNYWKKIRTKMVSMRNYCILI